jgi:hypothetical protein
MGEGHPRAADEASLCQRPAGRCLVQEVASLSIWRNGKLVEMRAWFGHAEALEAAGLRE